jgi:hypothetical protein
VRGNTNMVKDKEGAGRDDWGAETRRMYLLQEKASILA